MPIPYRPEVPPTEQILRGKARLLEQLSAISDGSSDPTLRSDEPDHPIAMTWNLHVRDENRYAFGEVFATGGLGVVRRGQDRRLGRPIAIKELLRDSPAAARRFSLEAAVTARLQHPGIVPLYDLGWQGEGKPYYCMQLVDGDSLEAKIAEAKDLTTRLRLIEHVIAVADAIAYAHERQIIHRDIKPANVLVGRFGETVVIDWGLAKDLSGTIVTGLDSGSDGELDRESMESRDGVSDMTEAGTVMGTLRYMSPEQAQGEAVDARSDVYSLGALLHHVLAGKPPFDGGEREDLIRRVLAGKLQPLLDADPSIPPELAAIAERAMSVQPDRRYASAAAFAEDLRSFQAGRMVSAHAYSPREVLSRWIRRHHVLVDVVLLTVAVITAISISAAMRIGEERALADEAEAAAAAENERAERLEFERRVVAEAKLAAEVLTLAQTPGRELEALARGVEIAAGAPEQAPDPAIAGLSRALSGVVPIMTLERPDGAAMDIIEPSADGSMVAITWRSPTNPKVHLWSLERGQKLAEIDLGMSDSKPRSLALSPDNRLLAVSDGRRCIVFDVQSGARSLEFEDCADPIFSTDGRTLFGKVPREELFGAVSGWDVDGTPRWTTPMAGENFVLLAHPDGERLIVRGDHLVQEAIEILDTATGERRASLARIPARPRRYGERSHAFARPEDVALSPDGRTLAVSETDEDGRLVLWDLESETPTVLELRGGYSSLPTFSADNRRLFVGGHPVRVYDLDRHELVSSLAMGAFVVRAGADGLAIADNRWIELPSGLSRQAAPPGRLRSVRATNDGRFVITASDADIRVWSTEDHLALERRPPPTDETIEHAEVRARAPGRPSIVALDSAAGFEIRDVSTGTTRCEIPASKWWEVALSDNGEVFVGTDSEGRGHVWDIEPCRERTLSRVYEPTADASQNMSPLRFAEDGALVLRHLGHTLLFDHRGREIPLEDETMAQSWWGISVLSPDGRVLAHSPSSSRSVAHLWDVQRNQPIADIDLRSYTTRPWFTSDGALLIFGAGNRELAIVRATDGRELLRIPISKMPTSFQKIRAREDQPIIDVLIIDKTLVSYPVTRAQLVDAACRLLSRSSLAAETATSCED